MSHDIAFLLSVLVGLSSPAVILTSAAQKSYDLLQMRVPNTLGWRRERADLALFGGLAALYWVLSVWVLFQLFRVTA